MSPTLLAIVLYVSVTLAIGFFVARFVRTEADYLLAGRRLGTFIVTCSLFATWFGAESCVGASGAIFEEGLRAGAADPFGYALCLFLMGLVYARVLHRRNITTLPDLLRERFSPTAERVAVLLMVPSSLLWGAAQIRAFGQVLALSSDLSFTLATVIAAATVVVYTASGGLLADAVTDVVQGAVLIAGLGLLGILVVTSQGGLAPALASVPPERLVLHDGSLFNTLERWAVPVCGSLFAQELVSRVLAARSPEVARRSAFGATGLYLAVGAVPAFIGLLGPTLAPGVGDPEQLLPTVAKNLLPPTAYVLFIGALISSILSTADSCLLVASSLVSHNVAVHLMPEMHDGVRVRVARLGVMGFGAVALVMALASDGVHALVQEASGFGSAGIFVACVFGIRGRFGGGASAVAAMMTGALVYGFGAYVLDLPHPYLLALALALFAYVACALAPSQRSALAG